MTTWGWNTWEATEPSEVLDPRSGLAVRVSAYSSKANDATPLPFSREVEFGLAACQRTLSRRDVPASRLPRARARGLPRATRCAAPSQVAPDGEWGLRFWFTLEVGFPGGEGEVRLDIPAGEAAYVDPPVAIATWAGGGAAFSPRSGR